MTYKKQTAISKVTVATVCSGQSFSLSVVAVSPTKGVASPAVTLTNGMAAADFITNIPATGTTNATATLKYSASATFEQGNSAELGNDVHTITYTLVAQ
ncbi:MAG TPA: hypothetical protein VMM57_01625 [Bacteroidota bacterium]|nr:hypothetical protein [Bacteroidota bacterium]